MHYLMSGAFNKIKSVSCSRTGYRQVSLCTHFHMALVLYLGRMWQYRHSTECMQLVTEI